MENMSADTISKVVLVIIQVVAALVATYLLPKLPALSQNLLEWTKGKAGSVKNAYASGVLQRLVDLIGQKVLMIENTVIEDLKEKARDGKLTPDELKEALKNAKQTALEAVKTHATSQGLWKAALDIFLGNENALAQWLDHTLEATVSKLPPSGLQTTGKPDMAPAMLSKVQPPPVP